MLTLGAKQFEKMAQGRRDRIASDVTDWLLEEFPGDGSVARDDVLREVRAAADVAWGWGIESTELVRLHVYVCKVLGRDYFEALPMLGEVLADRDLGDELKLAWFGGWVDAFKRRTEEQR